MVPAVYIYGGRYCDRATTALTIAVIIIAAEIMMEILQQRQANKIFPVKADEPLHRKEWGEAGEP